MKIKRKTLYAGILMTVLLLGLTGCRKNEQEETTGDMVISETAVLTEEQETESLTEEQETEILTEKQESKSDLQLESETESGYLAFLKGTKSAVVSSNEHYFPQGSYTLSEMVSFLSESFQEMDLPDALISTSYALIDCGMDGELEMAVKLDFQNESTYETASEYLILKERDGEVFCEVELNSYYRSAIFINQAGVMDLITMYGYTHSFVKEFFINAEGEIVFVFSCHTYDGLENNLIHEDFLPSYLQDKINIKWNSEDSSESYTLEIYNTWQYSDTFDDDMYDAYLANNEFIFYDEDGYCANPEDEVLSIYLDHGVRIEDDYELEESLRTYKESLGLTDEMCSADEIEWTEWDGRGDFENE